MLCIRASLMLPQNTMICSCVKRFLFIVRLPSIRPDSNPRWEKIAFAGQSNVWGKLGVIILASANKTLP